MSRLLTEEQLARVDEIIKDKTNIDVDYVFDGNDSLPQENVMGSLVEAARRVREYLASLATKAEGR